MNTPRDDEDDDRLLDLCLEEALGRRRPPDLVGSLRRAEPVATATAAAAVDAAARAVAPRTSAPWWLAAACVALCAGLGTWWLWQDPPAHPDDGAATPLATAQELLDEFHRCMPGHPTGLRNEDQRRRIVERALPVIRSILALRTGSSEQPAFDNRWDEFVVYAVVLGDRDILRTLQERAARGERDAEAVLAAADVITATEDAARATAVARMATQLDRTSPAVRSAAYCLLIAADLTADEARGLADRCREPILAQRFEIAAELAASSPRRLLHQPLELAGRTRDGHAFSTASLRGKVVLVCFWASWCEPCLRATPEVVALARRHPASDLAIVFVSCDNSRAALDAWLDRHPEVSWPVLFEPGQQGWHELAFLYGVRSIPSTFLLDREGRLQEVDAIGDLDSLVRRWIAR